MIKIETREVSEMLSECCNSCNKDTTYIREIHIGPKENSMLALKFCPNCYLELLKSMNKRKYK